jgi:hypothetical protein
MNKQPRRRRLAIESMENRLLLSGTQQLDTAVFNQDSVDSSQYAVISADAAQTTRDPVSIPNQFASLSGDALQLDSTFVLPNTSATNVFDFGVFQKLSIDSGNVQLAPANIGTRNSITWIDVNGNTTITQGWIQPQIHLTLPDVADARASLGYVRELGANSLAYSSIDPPLTDTTKDGGPVPIDVGPKVIGLETNVVTSRDSADVFTQPTSPGPVANHPTSTPISASEGGMIAVGDVLASLQRESTVVGGAETRLAMHHRAAGNELESVTSESVSANRLSGELARAVSFEVIDNQTATEHSQSDDGLSVKERLPVEVGGEKMSLATDGNSAHSVTANAAADSVSSAELHRRVVEANSGTLPIRLASFEASDGTAASVTGAWADAGHALVEAAALPTENLAGDGRGEVFSRWSRSDALHHRREDERHGLPWDMAPDLIVLGLERYLATKRRHDEEERDALRSTRRDASIAR